MPKEYIANPVKKLSKTIKNSSMIILNKNNEESFSKKISLVKKQNKIAFYSKITTKNVLTLLITTFFICINSFIECNRRYINSKFSYIIMTTNRTGKVQIISNGFYPLPDEISINNNSYIQIKNEYYLNDTNNIINLTWYNELETNSNMFKGCYNITSIDFSHFNTSKVKHMDYMFYGCSSLTELDLSNFDTTQVERMDYMFYGCSSLVYLDVSLFNTSKVINMNSMFYGCSSLTSLNLSKFCTSQVKYLGSMFYNCSSLKEIDLSHFDISNVKSINSLFFQCSSLTSLDLSNFDTSQVINMNSMFYGCLSLSSLNLSSFNISQTVSMNFIFYRCSSLKLLDISNFYSKNELSSSYMFHECTNLEYLNMNLINSNKKILQELNDSNITICTKTEDSEYEFKKKVFVYCISNNNISYINNNNENKCYTNNINIIAYNNICRICGVNYFVINNNLNETTTNSSINCYESPDGYYLDEKELIYKLCYISCKSCYRKGNETHHNCLKCNDEYIYHDNISNYTNCYKNNPNIINKSYELKHEYYQNKSDLKALINNIFNDVNISNIDNGIDTILREKNLIIILTSTLNQKNNEDKNNISMNLGQCENILKEEYNISINASLYILQIISEETSMKIPKIEYEVYYPLYNSKNLKKLDLTSCKDTKIEISISVKINDTLDKYNSSSEYYNDICYKTSSDYGTDISLKDRRDAFVENNMTLCEENCELIGYNYDKEKAKCSCNFKLNIPDNYDIKFNKKVFYKSFIDVKNIANLNIMKCYKNVFNINRLLKNYGFYIISFILLFYIITFFSFCCFSYIKLKIDLNKMFIVLIQNEKIKIKQTPKKPIKKNQNNNNENNKTGEKNFNIKNKKQTKRKIKKGRIKERSKQITQNNVDNQNNMININNINIEVRLADFIQIKEQYTKQLFEVKYFELDLLDYEEAIKLDKRTYLEFYISLLKNNHPFFFYFCSHRDYNSPIIKKFLFFFSFGLDFTINALFFNDETMHKIYEDKGKYNFIYQLPQIFYSTLISKFIDSIIRKLALSRDNIIEFKNIKIKEKIEQKYFQLLRIIKTKFIFFFIISFVFLLFFWYYIICFCGIYVNTQIHLLKDSVFSLIIGLLYPFVMCLLPGIFRIAALKVEKPTRGFLYKFSLFLENYLC